jgi:hypothetical protein
MAGCACGNSNADGTNGTLLSDAGAGIPAAKFCVPCIAFWFFVVTVIAVVWRRKKKKE